MTLRITNERDDHYRYPVSVVFNIIKFKVESIELSLYTIEESSNNYVNMYQGK